MKFETFLVGGAVRDELMGRDCNDLDFTVLAPSMDALVAEVEACGGEVFQVKPEFGTVRAMDRTGELGARGQVLDFVMPRRDSESGDGRRPDFVEAGTLMDDLARRDFTVNAMARNTRTGELVDPFGGREDLADGVLRAVGVAKDRFMEDALRVMRAFRFSVTLGFSVEQDTADAMRDPEVVALLASDAVSVERKREELVKAFRADQFTAMRRLVSMPVDMRDAFMPEGLRLEPTLKA
jgi:tRNA nucleotidyltransferase/poly(A) polymerase